jgi:hypothetical protein
VIREILKSGGRVALVHYSGSWTPDNLLHLHSIRREFGEDRITIVPAMAFISPNLWLCDYIGLFGKGSDGSCQHLQVQYLEADEDGPISGVAPIKFPEKIPTATVWPKIYAKGGDLLVLDAETIAISERTLLQNPQSLSPKKLSESLNKIGMKRAVFLPSTDDDVEHADTMVTIISGAAFIPQLYNGHNDLLRQRLETARERLEAAGFPVYSLPMMVPKSIGSSSDTLSPCNLRLVRALNGSLAALVPIPKDAPDDLKELIHQTLTEKGNVDRVVLLESCPKMGGLIHCMTAEVPDSLVRSFHGAD